MVTVEYNSTTSCVSAVTNTNTQHTNGPLLTRGVFSLPLDSSPEEGAPKSRQAREGTGRFRVLDVGDGATPSEWLASPDLKQATDCKRQNGEAPSPHRLNGKTPEQTSPGLNWKCWFKPGEGDCKRQLTIQGNDWALTRKIPPLPATPKGNRDRNSCQVWSRLEPPAGGWQP